MKAGWRNLPHRARRSTSTTGRRPARPALVGIDDRTSRILDEHGLVVCGWSGGWGEALRCAITRSRSRRYSVFWAARGELADAATRIVAGR